MEGPDWIQLDRCGEHNANSYDDDQSKYLKYEQIDAVADAVTVALQQSASKLRRNLQLAESPTKHIEPLLLRCLQRVVRASRAQFIVKQLHGFNIDSSFGSLPQFSEVKWLKTLVDRTMILKMKTTFISIYTAHSISVAISMQHGIYFTSILPRFGFYPIFFAKSPPDGFFS
jgi:hypothetical protein